MRITADIAGHGIASSGNFPGTVAILAVAIMVTAAPVFIHLSGQAAGIATCAVFAVLLGNFAPAAAPPVLIFSYLFQNFFVSLVSPHIADLPTFNAIRAYNFLLTATVWLVFAGHYWANRHAFTPRFRALMNGTLAVLILIGVYFVIGLAGNPKGAVVYLRNITTPFMLFQIFAIAACRFRLSMQSAIIAMGAAVLAYGYAETLLHDNLFQLIHGDTYIELTNRQAHDGGVYLKEMEQTGRVMRSYMDTLVVEFFNTSLFGDLGISLYRLLGPNFHPISFAYALGLLCLVFLATRHALLAALTVPLLLIVGSKGAVVLVVGAVVGLAASRPIGRRRFFWIYVGLLVVYAAVGIVVGMNGQDYHVIGFLGGVNGFPAHPLGRGLGAGGNLALDMAAVDWERFQNLGRTDVAMESAVGVLLYQMGLAGLALLGCVAWIGWKVWRLHLRTGDRLAGLVALGVLTTLTNGIFQEEALFAPLALGAVMGFAGLLLGRDCRGRHVAAGRARMTPQPRGAAFATVRAAPASGALRP